jgi:hypothetical protein
MKCFQEAYAKSKTYPQLKEVSVDIINLKTGLSVDNVDYYLKKFYNEEFCC